MADPQPTRRQRERQRESFSASPVANSSPRQLSTALTAGYEPDGKYFVGRDPRAMTPDDLKLIGHSPLSPMNAIRAKCLDCCAGSSDEVRKCRAIACPSWPFRTGKNPWRAPPSEAQRQAGRINAARLRQKSSDP